MTTAIAKGNGYLTVGDVLLLELPHVPQKDRESIAWEFTGYPCWWAGDDHIVNIFPAPTPRVSRWRIRNAMRHRIELTEGERRALRRAAGYYLNDADPTREGDLAGVRFQTWEALRRAIDKLDALSIRSHHKRDR